MITKETLDRWTAGYRLPALLFALAAVAALSFGPTAVFSAPSVAPLYEAKLSMISGAASLDGGGGAGAAMASRGAFEAAPRAEPESAFAAKAAQDAPRKIVRVANVSVVVADEPKARALAKAAALKAGATIDSDQTAAGDARCATLTFKVAPERFDALIAELEKLGRVQERALTSQNLGAEYVDLRSRLANMRKVEKRLHELLAFKTNKLADVLAVEKELERVGQEIETIEGRMKYIDALASSSTVTVTLSEAAKERPQTGLLVEVRNALVGALNTFIGTGLAMLKLTMWLAAIALWVVPVSLGLWKLKSR